MVFGATIQHFRVASTILRPQSLIWATFKCHLNSYSTPPTGLLQLWEYVEESFRTIAIDECERFYASMLDQIAVVLGTYGK
jgi:hypothetical protein